MQRRPPDNWTPSSLNDSNCLSLKQIVGSFSAPITEEHAWAIGKRCALKKIGPVHTKYWLNS